MDKVSLRSNRRLNLRFDHGKSAGKAQVAACGTVAKTVIDNDLYDVRTVITKMNYFFFVRHR